MIPDLIGEIFSTSQQVLYVLTACLSFETWGIAGNQLHFPVASRIDADGASLAINFIFQLPHVLMQMRQRWQSTSFSSCLTY
jgi:hypothetical protein